MADDEGVGQDEALSRVGCGGCAEMSTEKPRQKALSGAMNCAPTFRAADWGKGKAAFRAEGLRGNTSPDG